MYRVLALCCILGFTLGRQPDPPHHSADRLPDTVFSCRDKVLGGYYADPDAQCQMFHVCVKVAGVGIQDFRFLCPNGTAFDQEAQICAGWADVACEPAALYYSSDNFDLYRIGSGFESKKAPVTFEDEPDFHLQRAEPDILSGAHSSNFFNNRDGKDNHETSKVSAPARNQVDQPQRKKVIKKLQKRPTETTPRPIPSTTPKQFTNNFAGSYVPTTSRPYVSSSIGTTQAPQYSESYSDNQRYNNYQSAKPVANQYDSGKYYKSSPNPTPTKKVEQVNLNRNENNSFRTRPSSTQDYSYSTTESSPINNNNRQANYNEGTLQQNRRAQSLRQYNNYNSENNNEFKSPSQAPERRTYNRGRGQHRYQNSQSTANVNYNSETSPQPFEKQFSVQYNANKNTKNNFNNQYNYNQQSTPKYNTDYQKNDQVSNKQQTYQTSQSTANVKLNSGTSPQPFEKQSSVQNSANTNTKTNYNNQYNYNQQSTPKYNDYQKNDQVSNKQQTYQTSQSTANVKFNSETSPQPFEKQSSAQYNANTNTKNNYNNQYNYNQQSTPKYNTNYQNNEQSSNYNNQETTYQIKYNSVSTTQSTPQYSQQFTNNNAKQASTTYTTDGAQQYDKSKSTLKYNEKKTQFTTLKQSTPVFNTEIVNNQQYSKNVQQTPAPKFNTNLLYDNNQQSTPGYYDQQQHKSSPSSITTQGQQYSSPGSSFADYSNQYQKKTNDYQQYSTAQPSTYNSASNYNQQAFEQRNNSNLQQYSTARPSPSVSNTQRYEQKSTAAPFKSRKPEDYDDGQYRPEVHEKEAGGEYDVTVRQSERKVTAKPAVEQEFLKTAHSINIAASGNQLSRDSRPINSYTPSTTSVVTQQQQKITTQAPPRITNTTPSARSVYSSFAAVTSAAPRPFSLRPEQSSVAPQLVKKPVGSKASSSSPVKAVTSGKAKDVSYDYAYYDNSDHYSEYENIEEFGRTSKKQ